MSQTPVASVTLMVSTYNWKEALALALHSVAGQTRLPDEVVVVDDGSREDTAELLRAIAKTFPVPLRHVWQPDDGFRKARILNRGIAAARGEYVIQFDGDMLLHPRFVEDHLRLAQPGRFLQGTRIRTTDAETARLLGGGEPRFGLFVDAYFRDDRDRSTYHFGRRHHTLRLPWLARIKSRSTGHPMGCNVSFWREDLVRVNGYDERMHGYGSEDLEIDIRLRNAGLRRSQIKFAALALHLEHRSVSNQDPSDPELPNNKLMHVTVEQRLVRTEFGLDKHLADFAQSPADLRTSAGQHA
ncbi:glycosyltransferase family 2 protein [Dyella mobilis]|uniref:Glycosyltransferase family 2 protein n=1 Tax=Dyella mobilis TaxID=1849582 RepID=A0ABS2KEA8_9GAMM|nr:glycosyltransferase family 2 protein [Dyella mobilis]MBM7129434.1 glycosyltransferase family 2 protein [Dyella mobilis]GLQ98301.1 glycosyl transferase family 2 [Dyella mobilis]